MKTLFINLISKIATAADIPSTLQHYFWHYLSDEIISSRLQRKMCFNIHYFMTYHNHLLTSKSKLCSVSIPMETFLFIIFLKSMIVTHWIVLQYYFCILYSFYKLLREYLLSHFPPTFFNVIDCQCV